MSRFLWRVRNDSWHWSLKLSTLKSIKFPPARQCFVDQMRFWWRVRIIIECSLLPLTLYVFLDVKANVSSQLQCCWIVGDYYCVSLSCMGLDLTFDWTEDYDVCWRWCQSHGESFFFWYYGASALYSPSSTPLLFSWLSRGHDANGALLLYLCCWYRLLLLRRLLHIISLVYHHRDLRLHLDMDVQRAEEGHTVCEMASNWCRSGYCMIGYHFHTRDYRRAVEGNRGSRNWRSRWEWNTYKLHLYLTTANILRW